MIEREALSEAAIARRLTQLLVAILIGFGLVALALGYWSVVRSTALADRVDNPRLFEAELRVQRGRILDRLNNVLAENTGPADEQARSYPVAEAGPAVGHYSFRYGASGIEAAYDAVLSGSTDHTTQQVAGELLHVPPVGQDVRLSLDIELQQTASRLMEGEQGALVLLELTGTAEMPTAEIRAMVSQPWYDPAELDALFEDIGGEEVSLFNRATQGQYQPGLMLFPLLLASAIDAGAIEPTAEIANADRPVSVNGLTYRCLAEPASETIDWLEALRRVCAGAAADLGNRLGATGLINAVQAFGFLSTPDVPITTAEAVTPAIDDVALAAIGQEALTVSPLQMALAYSTLVDGRLPTPRLVDAVESVQDGWVTAEPDTPIASGGPALSPATATRVRQALPRFNRISGLSVPVLSAPDEQVNQWYVGLTPSDHPRYVVVVVLEQPADPETAATIGQAVLVQATAQP